MISPWTMHVHFDLILCIARNNKQYHSCRVKSTLQEMVRGAACVALCIMGIHFSL